MGQSVAFRRHAVERTPDIQRKSDIPRLKWMREAVLVMKDAVGDLAHPTSSTPTVRMFFVDLWANLEM